MDGLREVFDAVDFAGPFGPRARDFDHFAPEDRLFEHEPAILLPGSDEEGRAFAVGVVEHAHCVAEAAGDVQIDDAEPARGHRVAVGHRHDGHFLQAEDVLEAAVGDEGVVERHFGRAGIAEYMPHAVAGEEVEEDVDSGFCHGIDCIQFKKRMFQADCKS